MSLQLNLFTNRATVSSPVAPARSDRDGDVTVETPPSRSEYLSPICGKCGSQKRHSPHAKKVHNRFRCQPCNNENNQAWRRRVGKCRDRSPPEKTAARAAVNSMLKKGLLVRQPCQACGATKTVQAHHDDYSKPLDVMWLCTTHHAARHRYHDSLQA